MATLKFQREPNKKGGWTIEYKYLDRVQAAMRVDGDLDGIDDSFESIEAVLLALEKVGLK